jgi:hypothetical protein
MNETYEQYQKRMSAFPQEGLTILTEQEWKEATTPKAEPTVEDTPKPEAPKQRGFSATEEAHMEEIAAQAREADKLKADPPIDAWKKIGLTAEEQLLAERESNQAHVRALYAQENEDRRASEERQRKLEAEITQAEHMREQAEAALIADRIREKQRKAQTV